MDINDRTEQEFEAADTRPGSPDAQKLAENKEALQHYRQQLAKDPRNVMLLNEVGQAAEKAGDLERARWAYKRAIRLEPDHPASYRNLELLYQKEGREGPAVQALQKSIRRTGDVADLPVQEVSRGQADRMKAKTVRALDETPIFARLSEVWDELGLTPAEGMMLLDPVSNSGLKMMQVTLFDLVARGVLEADDRLRIGRGEGYGKMNLAPHEALFAKYFSRISDYVDVGQLARAALAELDDDGEVFKAAYVRASLLQKGYMEIATGRFAGILPVQHPVLSNKGALAKSRLKALLSEADRHLARSLSNDPQQANAFVDKGGPALLLVDAYPSRHFRRWHEMLKRMGFGPAITKLQARASRSSFGAIVDDILKALLGG